MTDAAIPDEAQSKAAGPEGDTPQAKVAATAEQVKKAVSDGAGVARDWATDRAGVARDWALDQSDMIRDTVQTRPFIAVGVSAASAFAAGLVLGVLLTRR
jgi:ElaB/YqjD/DUF883 family membrane-anchored ribosome-binding protein